jgi:hypothetical protein
MTSPTIIKANIKQYKSRPLPFTQTIGLKFRFWREKYNQTLGPHVTSNETSEYIDLQDLYDSSVYKRG